MLSRAVCQSPVAPFYMPGGVPLFSPGRPDPGLPSPTRNCITPSKPTPKSEARLLLLTYKTTTCTPETGALSTNKTAGKKNGAPESGARPIPPPSSPLQSEVTALQTKVLRPPST